MTTRREPATRPQGAEPRLRALVEVARAVSFAGATERHVATLVADLAARLVGDAATVWLRVPGGSVLERVGSVHPEGSVHAASSANHRPTSSRPAQLRLDQADGLLTAVLESGVAAVLDDAELVDTAGDETLEPWLDLAGLASLAVLALHSETSVAGVLVVTRPSGGTRYDADDVAFLQALADTAAAALTAGNILAGSAAAAEDMRRQAELVDQVSDVIMAWDADYRLITWNAAAERVYLYSAADALGCDAQILLNTAFYSEDREPVDREDVLTELHVTGHWTGELRQRRGDGQEIEVLSSITELFDPNGQPAGGVAVNRDITEQRRKEQMALYDTLTGLPNRRFLLDHLGRAVVRPNVGPLAVFFLDLDGFKAVNDNLGHEAGDEVLRVTAQRLSAALRRNDIVARLGGDEFVAVTEQVGDAMHAREIADRILVATGVPIRVGGQAVTVVPSIGVALTQPGPGLTRQPDELIKLADGAMYEAKRGKSGLCFAESDEFPEPDGPAEPAEPAVPAHDVQPPDRRGQGPASSK